MQEVNYGHKSAFRLFLFWWFQRANLATMLPSTGDDETEKKLFQILLQRRCHEFAESSVTLQQKKHGEFFERDFQLKIRHEGVCQLIARCNFYKSLQLVTNDESFYKQNPNLFANIRYVKSVNSLLSLSRDESLFLFSFVRSTPKRRTKKKKSAKNQNKQKFPHKSRKIFN